MADTARVVYVAIPCWAIQLDVPVAVRAAAHITREQARTQSLTAGPLRAQREDGVVYFMREVT